MAMIMIDTITHFLALIVVYFPIATLCLTAVILILAAVALCMAIATFRVQDRSNDTGQRNLALYQSNCDDLQLARLSSSSLVTNKVVSNFGAALSSVAYKLGPFRLMSPKLHSVCYSSPLSSPATINCCNCSYPFRMLISSTATRLRLLPYASSRDPASNLRTSSRLQMGH